MVGFGFHTRRKTQHATTVSTLVKCVCLSGQLHMILKSLVVSLPFGLGSVLVSGEAVLTTLLTCTAVCHEPLRQLLLYFSGDTFCLKEQSVFVINSLTLPPAPLSPQAAASGAPPPTDCSGSAGTHSDLSLTSAAQRPAWPTGQERV